MNSNITDQSDKDGKINITNYTIDDFDNMSIFDLRDVAAFLNVPSPTIHSKRKLVDLTYMAKCGLLEPTKREGRGRPNKPAKNEYYLDRDSIPELSNLQESFPTKDGGSAIIVKEGVIKFNSTEEEKIKVGKNSELLIDDEAAKLLLSEGDSDMYEGVLDILPDGYGFLRAENCECTDKDAYISSKLIKGCGLRRGDLVVGVGKKNIENRPAAISTVRTVNGKPVAKTRDRKYFDNLVPIYPDSRMTLESKVGRADPAIRCIDLIAPIGKGQRAMIVSPPKAGKTTLLKKIANCITANYPSSELFVLLIDERPEEVTDMRRSIKGEVIYSTFDETPEHHTKAAELVIERAKRLVELGKDVVIIMDSLTRLARAYNLVIPPTGRSLSGGIDPGALHNPKRFFGAARNIEGGGSLTIIATALIDTGSRMDDVIFEEFKGTGNMEIHLDRELSEKRIFPAVNLNKSGTRREDLLLSQDELDAVWYMRKLLSSDSQDSTENLLNMLYKTKNNSEFIEQLKLQMRSMEKNGYTFRK